MLPETVAEAARRFGEATLFVADDGWSLSYRELDRLSDEVAVGLARRGVGVGDVVALVLPSVPEYAVAYAAAAKLGAVTAGINYRLSPDERAGVLEVADPRVVITTDEFPPAGRAEDVLSELRFEAERPPPLPPDPERPATIVFTSGTTGAPKGVVFRRRQIEAIAGIDSRGAWGGGGRSLSPTPFPHIGFMTKSNWQLRSGGVTFLMSRWRPEDALRVTAEQRLTMAGGIPTQVALMLRVPEFDTFDLTSVALVVVGGGPAPPSLVREAEARFDAPVVVRYSTTESGGVGLGTDSGDPLDEDGLCVGRPRGPVVVSILDDDDRPVPTGELGLVCLRSPAVMSGYYHDSEQTAAAFTADGSVRTGDLGWEDGEGRVHLAGRNKERYVRGGYNVHPVEVEAVLSDHPAIAAVAIVPQLDPVMGQIGVAAVVPRPGAPVPTLEELRAFAAPRLASFKLPEQVVVVDEIPLTPMEKFDRPALERLLTQRSSERSE